MSTTLDAVIASLQETGLVSPEQLAEVTAPGASPPDAATLTSRLIERGILTPFQATQVAAGKAKTLVIGAYVMLDRLNGGGGLLFKAQHRRMQRVVMIKPLAPSLMKTAAARVQREAALAGRTTHANLVAVQDLDEVGGAYFLVTEFVEGTDLASLLKQQGRLDVVTACNYAAQAATGLAAAHAQGLTHREVKAENLFLDRSGTVKVFGLGVATTEAGDATDDVAALGRTLQRLLSGADVPACATPLPALRTVRPDANAALEAYVARMTSAAAGDRPTMLEAAAALGSPESLPQPPAAESAMFPELFAEAEQEAATVMFSAPEAAVASAVPDSTPAAAPPVTAPVSAPISFAPAVAVPAPEPATPSPTVPLPAPIEFAINPQPAAAAPVAPAPTFAPPAFAPPAGFPSSPAPTPSAPASAPAMPEFALNAAAAPAPAPFVPAPPSPAAFAPPAAAPVAAPGEFTISFSAPPTATSSIADAPTMGPATETSTASSAAARKKTKAKKPIDLPFNLKLDPKYLEPKYLAGAGGGVVLLLTLLVYAVAGGSKPAKLKPVPVAPATARTQPAPAAVPPGMFQLPDSGTLNTVSPAGTGPDANFGLPTLPPPKPRR